MKKAMVASQSSSASPPASPPNELQVHALAEELVRCTSFEDAARVVLSHAIALAQRVLVRSRFAATARVVRGVIHLRPHDGYRGLVVVETEAAKPRGDDDGRLTSTTAWRWVVATRRPVAIDVHAGRIDLVAGFAPAKLHEPRAAGGSDFCGGETHSGLIARDVTHVQVVPLLGMLGVVDGMLSIEVACRAAIGAPSPWGDCERDLQLCAVMAAPYLAGLPSRGARASQETDTEADVDPFLPVIGASMAPIVELLRTFARQDEPILVTGPTGAGKSRLARFCHEHSRRKGKPFEVLDLCSVPEALQMAELFGWKRGAFTGAVRDKVGYLAQAEGGTVFLDEVDNLSPQAQAGLLRVLEERAYRVLGDERRDLQADVRFIVGSNARLETAVREKRFREDLYYRINVLPVRLPPLAERADEIVPWARYMANRRHGDTAGRAEPLAIAPRAGALLEARAWPGNLRQLDNVVRRAYAIASMAHGEPKPASMVIGEEHVRHALAYEDADGGPTADSSLIDKLIAAATAFVHEAERRGGGAGGGTLDLDMAEAFKGFVVGVATMECDGDRDRAFAMLGKDRLAKARNHHKVLRRELERVEDLCARLGVGAPPFVRIAGRAESDDDRPRGTRGERL
jgi:DNA-binding NtrC family response regulator